MPTPVGSAADDGHVPWLVPGDEFVQGSLAIHGSVPLRSIRQSRDATSSLLWESQRKIGTESRNVDTR